MTLALFNSSNFDLSLCESYLELILLNWRKKVNVINIMKDALLSEKIWERNEKNKELLGNTSKIPKTYKYIFGRARCPVSSLWILSSCITRIEKNIFLYFFLLEICSHHTIHTMFLVSYWWIQMRIRNAACINW